MTCNAYAAAAVGPANEIKIAQMMMDLARKERHMAGLPTISPPGTGGRGGRPRNWRRDLAVKVLKERGPLPKREVAAALGITSGQASDSLRSALRFGLVTCTGHLWSAE